MGTSIKIDYKEDFATVNLIANSTLETRGVDAFVLSLIKAEKQMRRIFTYLIFQAPEYTLADYQNLRKTLAENKQIYFDGFIKGINLILTKPLKEIYGKDYDNDITDLIEFTKDRNKIFHGQITPNGLSREDLINRVNHIKKWCQTLGEKLKKEIGYDGFGDSYCKTPFKLQLKNMNQFNTLTKYKSFLKNKLQR